jgi:hypothetical protein
MHVRAGRENQDFSSLIFPNNRYVRLGFYYSELTPFFELFDKHKINIILFEDFCRNPQSVLQSLFRQLGVDDQFIPNMTKKSREGGLPKNSTLNNLLVKKNPIRSSISALIKPFMPEQLRQKVCHKLIQENTVKAQLSPEIRLKLQDLIQRDLSLWL